MEWFTVTTAALGFLAAAPAFLIAYLIYTHSRVRAMTATAPAHDELLYAGALRQALARSLAERSVPVAADREAVQVDLRAAVRQAASNYVAPQTTGQRLFVCTIKPLAHVAPRQALNFGGYGEVPLLLHDASGNCYTIYRRIYLN